MSRSMVSVVRALSDKPNSSSQGQMKCNYQWYQTRQISHRLQPVIEKLEKLATFEAENKMKVVFDLTTEHDTTFHTHEISRCRGRFTVK